VFGLTLEFRNKHVSETFIFEKYLPVSTHKEALQVKLPGGLTAADICRTLKISKAMLYRSIKTGERQ
jgi:hypothetical protein